MATLPAHEDAIPHMALRAGFAMVVLALVAAAFGRLTGVGTVRVMPVLGAETRDLTFDVRADGSIAVRDVKFADNSPLYVVPAAGAEGFVRVALQTFLRDRVAAGVSADAPYRLMRQVQAGTPRLWLEDLTTHRRITLDAFGSGNAKVFAKFFDVTTQDALASDTRKATP